MAKIYIAVLVNNNVHGAIVDLENLPLGANSHTVKHPWLQGKELVSWFAGDLSRAQRVTSNISSELYNQEAIDFISNLASFWENLPPPNERKDGLLTTMAKDEGDFVRTSPAVAQDTWVNLCKLRTQK